MSFRKECLRYCKGAAWAAMGLVSVFGAACSAGEGEVPKSETPVISAKLDGGSGSVTEVIEAERYTFICINSGEKAYWLASTLKEVKVGDVLVYEGALVMRDFRSETLDRTFPVILFVNRAWVSEKSPASIQRLTGIPSGHPLVPESSRSSSGSTTQPVSLVLPADPGARRLKQIAAEADSLAGQQVRFVGKVTKVNSNIMGLNWVHLQDGTSGPGISELIVTSTESASVGDVVAATGVLAANKTLNRGYFFPILLENAVFQKLGKKQ